MKQKKARLGGLYSESWCSKKERGVQESKMRPVTRMAANQVAAVGIEAGLPKKETEAYYKA
jgi:hypothetical protein